MFRYTIFGSGYGNLDVFDKSALEWFPVCILGALIAGTVQLFYGYRLYSLSRSKIAGVIVAVVRFLSAGFIRIYISWAQLAVLQVGSGIGQGIISKLVTDRSDLSMKPICVTVRSFHHPTFECTSDLPCVDLAAQQCALRSPHCGIHVVLCDLSGPTSFTMP